MSPTLAQLTDLRDRVRAATGPDPDIDHALMSLGWDYEPDKYAAPFWVEKDTRKQVITSFFRFMSSLDAALRFVERMCPTADIDWQKTILTDGRTVWGARVGPVLSVHVIARHRAATAPLALLLAALSALIAQQEAADGE